MSIRRGRLCYALLVVLLPCVAYNLLTAMCQTRIYCKLYEFDPDAHAVLEKRREARAEAEIKALIDSKWCHTPPVQPIFCAPILVSNRTRRYSLVSIAALLRQLRAEPEFANSFHFTVLDTSLSPSSSSTMALFHQLLPVVNCKPPHGNGPNESPVNAWTRKEASDYVQALDLCIDSTAPYALLLEEDSLAGKRALHTLVELTKDKRLARNDWLMVKLYKTEQFLGWSADRPITDPLTVVSIGLVAGIIIEKLASLIAGYGLRWRNTSILFLVYCSIIAVVFIAILGRQHVLQVPPRGLSEFYDDPLGSVANMYPRTVLPALRSAIATRDPTPGLDLVIGAFRREGEWKEYQYVPRPFQHIGILTSAPRLWLPPKYTWRNAVNWEED